MQLKALGIDENIGHCDALCGLKCSLAYSHACVIVQTTLVVALLYFFVILIFSVSSKVTVIVKTVYFLWNKKV